jgi:hypothetical protein
MSADMNQMFAGQMKDPPVKVKFSGAPVELPDNLQPGQSLKNANINMTIDMSIIKMDTLIKTLTIKNVTVPAGTF